MCCKFTITLYGTTPVWIPSLWWDASKCGNFSDILPGMPQNYTICTLGTPWESEIFCKKNIRRGQCWEITPATQSIWKLTVCYSWGQKCGCGENGNVWNHLFSLELLPHQLGLREIVLLPLINSEKMPLWQSAFCLFFRQQLAWKTQFQKCYCCTWLVKRKKN